MEKPLNIKIYTSYYAQLPKLLKDENNICISISHSIPSYIDKSNLLIDKSFAPTWSILSEYKEQPNEERYIERFKTEVLSKVNFEEKIKLWEKEHYNKSIILLCYDKVTDFCHRHIVGEALENFIDNKICEKFYENNEKKDYRVIVEMPIKAPRKKNNSIKDN